MTEKEFKKLLIDLDVEIQAIAEEIGISPWAVTLYFRGQLTSRTRRAEIRKYLARRARERGVDLPEFWMDAEAA